MSNTYEFINADGSRSFGSSRNWIDETSPTTPGPPGPTDTAVVSAAGRITGTADVGALVLDGSHGTLTPTGQDVAATTLELEGRVAFTRGSVYSVTGDVEQVGKSTVTMSGGSDMLISPATGAGTAALAVAGSSGDQATFDLKGSGTQVELAQGNAVIGGAGSGVMMIRDGAQLQTDVGDVILGGTAGGPGTLSVTGPLSALMAAGQIQVAQGRLAILDRAEVSSLGLTIEAATGESASVLVRGEGSRLTTGNTSIGGEPGTSSLTIARGGFAQVASLQIGAPGVFGTNSVSVKGAGSTLVIRGGLTLGEFQIGRGGSFTHDSGSLDITSGGHVLQDSNSVDVVGQEGSSTGSITVSGEGSLLDTGVASLIVGDDGIGSVAIKSGGEIRSSSASGQAVTVGHYSNGSVSIDGAGSDWTATGEFTVGYYGTGTVHVMAGASLETGSSDSAVGFVLGEQAGGSGAATITGAGSTLTNSGEFIIGGAGTGSLTIADGGDVTTRGSADLGNGTIQLDGGTFDAAGTLTLATGQSLSGHGTAEAFGIINAATVQASGGTLNLIGGITGAGTLEIDAGSTLSLSGSASSGQEMKFEAATGRLVLGTPASFHSTIYDFIKGDTIDLSKVIAKSLAYSGHTLTVHESGGAALSLTFSGAYSQSSFGMTADGHGGTLITHS